MAVTPESPAFPEVDAVPGFDEDAHADADAHAYQHGTMPIQEQAATFTAFMAMSKWGALAIAALLAWLTIWFMPGGSWFGGLIAAVVIVVAGVALLRKPKTAH